MHCFLREAVKDGWMVAKEVRVAVKDGWMVAEEVRVAVKDGWMVAKEGRMAAKDGRIVVKKGRVWPKKEGWLATTLGHFSENPIYVQQLPSLKEIEIFKSSGDPEAHTYYRGGGGRMPDQ